MKIDQIVRIHRELLLQRELKFNIAYKQATFSFGSRPPCCPPVVVVVIVAAAAAIVSL